MNAERIDEKAVFNTARKFTDPEARSSYIKLACAENPEAQQRVLDLLRVHEQQQSFLESPPPGLDVTQGVFPITEQPGDTIGPYKLLQQLGEGGMGVVYMAEQKEPVKRRVALKIIKPGMDTRQVIARFEAERQALAMMDHPNIAKVLDAGQTESGRPYFVMELVNGLPVTKYCDEQHLNPKERLELFVPICQAVQHAHQKGIIHRDLKPSNILVAMYDNKAVPKIIDFGVAKATSQTLTEKTIFTQLGQVVGTLEYMSPEQAQRNQLDIDTRSDIYSLGVVLYELLTGEIPFDRERLRSAAFDEMLRIIREEEPSKPSTKVSSSLSLPSIAANRRIEPAKLGSMIRGELDWIVLKAMEKDRGRRYETASKFAEDVQHYLNYEAVVACPPSQAYKIRKFVRRHKLHVGLGALCLLLLVTFAASGNLVDLTVLLREQTRCADAAELLQVALDQGKTDIRVWGQMAACQRSLGNQAEFQRAWSRVLIEFPSPEERRAVDWGHLAQWMFRAGLYDEAKDALETCIRLRGDTEPTLALGPRWWYYTATLCQLGEAGRARTYYEQLVAIMNENPPVNLEMHQGLQNDVMRLLDQELNRAMTADPSTGDAETTVK